MAKTDWSDGAGGGSSASPWTSTSSQLLFSTVEVGLSMVVDLPAGINLGHARFIRDGDDLRVFVENGEEILIRDYFTRLDPPILKDTDGGQADAALVTSFLEGGQMVQLAQAGTGANNPIGQVSSINGGVFVVRSDGSRLELNQNAQVFQNDVVKTQAGGSIRITFLDGTVFALGPDGRMALNEFVYDPATQTGKTVTSILKGVFVFTSGQIAASNNTDMTINTPVVNIGIRGTKAAGDIRPPGQTSTFTIIEGAIVLTNAAGSVVLNEEGESATVTNFNSPPSAPFTITDAQALGLYGAVLPSAGGLLQEFQDGIDAPAGTDDQGNNGETEDGNLVPESQNLQQQGFLNNPELNGNDGLGVLVSINGGIFGGTGGIFDSDDDGIFSGGDVADLLSGIADGTEDAGGLDGGLLTEDPGPAPDPIIDPPGITDTGTGGPDNITGTDLDDILFGGGGNDVIDGGAGDDTIDGGIGDDILAGGLGNDTISGGDGNDTITGDAGNDTIFGGAGDDVLIGGSGEGNDYYDGGSGTDLLKYPSAFNPLNINLKTGITVGGAEIGTDTFINIENVLAGQGDDTIIVGYGDNEIDGGPGTDIVVFEGPASNYSITTGNNEVTVTDINLGDGDEGANILTNIEAVQFSDGIVPTATIADITVDEGDAAVFTITLGAASGNTVSVNYQTSLVAATASAADLVGGSGTVIFAPGEISKTFSVVTLEDVLFEGDETFFVDLSPVGSNVIIGDAQAQATINDDDQIVTVSISNGVPGLALEGNSHVFTISLSQATVRDVDIDYITVNGSATAGLDFTAEAGTLTILAGDISGTVTVNSLIDALDENNESFFLQISNAIFDPGVTNQSLTISDFTGNASIRDLPDININNATAEEGEQLTFTVSLNYAATATVTVDYQTSVVSGTASAGDIVATSGTLTFLAGETSKSVVVSTVEDNEVEANETFNITLSAHTGPANLVDASGLGTIIDDEAGPSVSIADATISPRPEGDSFEFVVTLSEMASENVVISYQTVNGTAVSGSDYSSTSGSLTIFTGNTTGSITVNSLIDGVAEGNEDFSVQLNNAVLGPGVIDKTLIISDASGTGIISDFPGVSVDDVASAEGTPATFTITLSEAAVDTVVINYQTTIVGGTADANDLVGSAGSVTFTPGETSKMVVVNTNQDTDVEGHETYFLQLFPNAGSAVIVDNTGMGTIYDDDGVLTVSISDAVPEPVFEGTSQIFTVTLSRIAADDVRVFYNTTNGSATGGDDFGAQSSFVTIAAGTISTTINITTFLDFNDETDETYDITLTSAVLDPGGTNTAVTITDDTGNATISDVIAIIIDDISFNEGDSDSFTVTLSGAATSTITVDYQSSVVSGTAEAGDLTTASGTLSFAPGETVKTILITSTEDPDPEGDETFHVNLSNPVGGAAILDGQGLGTILDDDTVAEVLITDALISPVSEGEDVEFTVELSAVLPENVQVFFNTVNGTAISGSDFNGYSSSVTILAGQTTATITVTTINDGSPEGDEDFTVFLSSAILDPGGSNQALVITDDSGAATIPDVPSITIDDVGGNEGDNVTFTITLSSAASNTVTVDYQTTDGSYSAEATDYTGVSGTLTFLAGETSKMVVVSTVEDTIFEGAETFALSLSNLTGPGALVDAIGVATISDDDTAITVSVADGLPNPTTESGMVDFVISISDPVDEAVFVSYNTVSGSATGNVDYTHVSSFTIIAAGNTSATVSVSTLTDVEDEADETFDLVLTSAVLQQISGTNVPLTITDDTAVGTISDAASLTIDDVTVNEGDIATFTVTLSEPVTSTVTVDYQTSLAAPSTAEAGDFTAASGTVTFNPGDVSKTIMITTVEETAFEYDETFKVELSNITGPAAFVDDTGVATILDDDPQPTVSISDGVASPTIESGMVTFTVTLSGIAGEDLHVNYETISGTALAGDDYTGLNSVLVIAAGDTSGTIMVDTLADGLMEADETFYVKIWDAKLPAASNYTLNITDALGNGLITDAPGVSINTASSLEGDVATFTVTLSEAAATTVTVNYEITATGGSAIFNDLTETTGSVVFNPGDTNKIINVTTTEDSNLESDETYFVNLTSVVGLAGITVAMGLGTILNDDPPTGLAISDGNPVVAVEGDQIVFTVTLTSVANFDVDVDYTTVNGSATGGADFTAISGTLTINAGDLTGELTVTTSSGDAIEGSEDFTLQISNARFDPGGVNQAMSITDASGLGGITEANTATFTNGGADGKWITAANWDTGVVPTSSTNVVITTGAVEITSGSEAVYSLTVSGGFFNIQNAALEIFSASTLTGGETQFGASTLTLHDELTLLGGELTLTSATVSGGTLRFATGSDLALGGTTWFDDVDLRGDITLDFNTSIVLQYGSTILQSNDAGPGQITIPTLGNILFYGSQTLSNMSFTTSTTIYNIFYGFGQVAGENFTIDNSVIFQGTRGVFNSSASDITVSNEGQILANYAGGNQQMYIQGTGSWSNTGTISASNNNFLNVYPLSMTNAVGGTISASGGGILQLGQGVFSETNTNFTDFINAGNITVDASSLTLQGDFVNTGSLAATNASTITLSGKLSGAGSLSITDSTIDFAGLVTTSALGDVTRAGSSNVTISGTLNNIGATLDLDTFGSLTLSSAEVIGGTIHFTTGTDLEFVSTTFFDGVAIRGDIILDEILERIVLQNGSTVLQEGGGGPGQIFMSGASNNYVFFWGSQTVSNLTINFDSTIHPGYASFGTTGLSGENFIIASDVTLKGGYGTLLTGGTNVTIVNNGTFIADYIGGGRNISLSLALDTQFTNSGTLSATTGNNFVISNGVFSNTNIVHISGGGTFNLGNANTVFSNSGTITVDNSTLILDGSLDAVDLGNYSIIGAGQFRLSADMDNTGNTLDLDAVDTLTLAGANITGGILHFTNSSSLNILSPGSYFYGVEIRGDVVINNTSGVIVLDPGSQVLQANGSTPGTIALSANNAQLYFTGSQTISNVTITFDYTSVTPDIIFGVPDTDETFIIDSSTTINGGNGSITNFGSDLTIINDGLIITDYVGGGRAINIHGAADIIWSNTGTIGASGGNNLQILALNFTNAVGGFFNVTGSSSFIFGNTNSTNIINAGAITVTDSTFTFKGAWSNSGTINATDSTVDYDGTFAVSSLTGLSRTGTVVVKINGVMDNTGNTLDLDIFGAVSFATATITGGTIHFATSTDFDVLNSTTTFIGTAIRGDVLLDNTSGYMSLIGGSTVLQENGSGPGLVTLTGNNSRLYFADSQTVSDLNIVFNYTSNTPDLYFGDGTAGQSFTIASSTIIQGGNGAIRQNGNNISITNEGQIIADYALGGRTIIITGAADTTWINGGTNGTIGASLGNTMDIDAINFTNAAGGHLSVETGGTFNLGASTSVLVNLGTINVDDGTLVINGTVGNDFFTGVTKSAAAVVKLIGDLTITGTFDLDVMGILSVDGATITGGTLAFSNTNNLDVLSGTTVFDATLIKGDVLLDNTSGYIRLQNGATVQQNNGSTPGMITITGNNARVYFDDSQTVSDLTINFDYTSNTPDVYFGDGSGSQSFTIAASTIIQGGNGYLRYNGANVSITNEGQILANYAGARTIGITGAATTTWINDGTIAASLGSSFRMDAQNFTNSASGTLAVSGSGTFFLGTSSSNITNAGAITVTSSSLVVDGTITIGSLNNLTQTGSSTVTIKATVQNLGNTIDLDLMGPLVFDDATIVDGFIQFATSSDLDVAAGTTTLDSVAVRGDVLLDITSGGLNLTNGSTISQFGNVLPGKVMITGNNANLRFGDSQTISNLEVTIDYSGQTPDIYFGDGTASQSFIIASTTTIQGGAGDIRHQGSNLTIDNHGQILSNDGAGGRTLTINGAADTAWGNHGLMEASSGNTLTIDALNFTNYSTGTLSVLGNTSTLEFGSTLNLQAGILSGYGNFDGTINLNGGTMIVGAVSSTGVLNQTGGITLTQGAMQLEIEGTSAGQFDKLAVTGAMVLTAGVIEIDFISGYTPSGGETFQILSATTGITYTDGDAAYAFKNVQASFDFSMAFNANDMTLTTNNGDVTGTTTIFIGSSGADIYTAETTDDILVSNGGADILDGDDGYDTLRVDTTTINFDATGLAASDIEAMDLGSNGASDIRDVTIDADFLTAAVTGSSDPISADRLVIDGDASDTLNLVDGTNWSNTGANNEQPGYTAYSHSSSLATALVDNDITVNLL